MTEPIFAHEKLGVHRLLIDRVAVSQGIANTMAVSIEYKYEYRDAEYKSGSRTHRQSDQPAHVFELVLPPRRGKAVVPHFTVGMAALSAQAAKDARKQPKNTRIGVLPICHYDELVEEPAMSETATELIRTFSTLSPQERHAVLIELARISEDDDAFLSDGELAYAGEQLFSMYDAEEADHGETQAR